MTQTVNIWLQFHRSLWLCSFFPPVCFLSVGQFGLFCFSSLILFFVSFILLLSLDNEFSVLVIVYFCSKISIWVFFISSVHLLRISIFYLIFSLFSFVVSMLVIAFFQSILMIVSLKSLSDNLSAQCWYLLIVFLKFSLRSVLFLV